jgi:hypothetical protein
MSDQDIIDEIFQIVEKDLHGRELRKIDIFTLNQRVVELIGMLDDGPIKDRVIAKLEAKKRWGYYINDTGIIDFTGFGEHLH